jgi:hypothetical protein
MDEPNRHDLPPPKDKTGTWATVAILAVIVLGGALYIYNHRSEQTAANPDLAATTTGSPASGDSRMAPPPPAPVK